MHKEIALSYKIPRLTSFIEEDYKLIKRIQSTLIKFERNPKDILILEMFNILRTLNNIFDMNKLYLILCSETDFKYHQTIEYLIHNIEDFNSDNIIKKFKELSCE